MNVRVATLAIGSEILDGRVLDSNSRYIAENLSKEGLRLEHSLSCDDSRESILSSLKWLTSRSSIIILTGGLGPTSDDITRESAAEFCSLELKQDQKTLLWLRDLFARRGRSFSQLNERQSYFPEGSLIIDNPVGTAPGFIVQHPSGVLLASLPGVPSEMKEMLPFVISETKKRSAPCQAPEKMAFRTFGLPESTLAEKIESIALAKEITVSYRAHFPVVDLLLKSTTPGLLNNKLKSVITSAIGAEYVFSDDLESNLPDIVHDLLIGQRKSIGLAESCTAGLLGKILSDKPGASAFLSGGLIAYSNEIKVRELDVSREILEQHGAVSEQTAAAMANGARVKFATDIALSITGIAGPGGGSEDKPTGTFFAALADEQGCVVTRGLSPLSRDKVRLYAAFTALDMLRRRLGNIDTGSL